MCTDRRCSAELSAHDRGLLSVCTLKLRMQGLRRLLSLKAWRSGAELSTELSTHDLGLLNVRTLRLRMQGLLRLLSLNAWRSGAELSHDLGLLSARALRLLLRLLTLNDRRSGAELSPGRCKTRYAGKDRRRCARKHPSSLRLSLNDTGIRSALLAGHGRHRARKRSSNWCLLRDMRPNHLDLMWCDRRHGARCCWELLKVEPEYWCNRESVRLSSETREPVRRSGAEPDGVRVRGGGRVEEYASGSRRHRILKCKSLDRPLASS